MLVLLVLLLRGSDRCTACYTRTVMYCVVPKAAAAATAAATAAAVGLAVGSPHVSCIGYRYPGFLR